MRAVVLETRGSFAAVLRDDGVVEKIRRVCQVGETIELAEKKIIDFPKRMGQWAAAAAAAIILFTGGILGYNNAYAYSYVTMDTNPSIEYVLNRKNQVLRVTALNEDAQSIVDGVNERRSRKDSLTDVIGQTTERLYEQAYLGEDCDNYILISVASHGDRQARSLIEEVDEYYIGYNDELTVVVTEATTREAREAQKLGVSTGRYKMAEDIVGSEGGGITQEDADRFGEMPVSELLEERGPEPIHVVGQTPPPKPEEGAASSEPGQAPGESSPPPKPEGEAGFAPPGESAPPQKPQEVFGFVPQDAGSPPPKPEGEAEFAAQTESSPPPKPEESAKPISQTESSPPPKPEGGTGSAPQPGSSPQPAPGGDSDPVPAPPQGGGYDPVPPQGGYDPAPPQGGGYDPAPPQGGGPGGPSN